jgi:cytoskeletal protein CcmA (bactofilin family)
VAKNESGLDTVIGQGTRVQGEFQVSGCLRLDGRIEGRVEVSETFMAGQRSLLRGGLQCRDAVFAGRIEGDIVAVGAVELQTGAEVLGNITCGSIVIQRGCVFQGNCTMQRAGSTGDRQ